ncbi:MAG: DUF2383 domain-containing protein [Caldicoprobacter sp.]|uniref:DUF2383 domain-containing protein n=1 Tax=Caldicoprobacter sp. TaxID=2004500 RepID=UPI0039C078F2
MHNGEAIKSLNQLLQGEYMAVESFNNFLSRLDEENVRQVFKEVQKQHRENISRLASYIQDIGGKPEENLGLKRKMGEIKINMDLGSHPDTAKIIEKAIEGETQGVNMAEKVLRGNLDDRSRDVVGEILNNDRKSIEKLKSLLKSITDNRDISYSILIVQ